MTVLNRAPGAPVGKPMSDEILQNGSTPSMQKLQQLAESGGFQVQYQDTTQVRLSYSPVDPKTRKITGTSCQVEIHFSIQIIKFVMKYNLLCF